SRETATPRRRIGTSMLSVACATTFHGETGNERVSRRERFNGGRPRAGASLLRRPDAARCRELSHFGPAAAPIAHSCAGAGQGGLGDCESGTREAETGNRRADRSCRPGSGGGEV